MNPKNLVKILILFSIFLLISCGDNNVDGDGANGEENPVTVDTDSDSVVDPYDNCPGVYNPGQADHDGDGYGNLCDEDYLDSIEDVKIYYKDADGDDYGDPDSSVEAGEQPLGYTLDYTDCNDGNANIHPYATEVCDGLNNDCDSEVDENVKSTFYKDQDNDGYGDSAETEVGCDMLKGFVENSDDNCPNIYNPDQYDVCDFSETIDLEETGQTIKEAIEDIKSDDGHVLILIPEGEQDVTNTITIENKSITVMPKDGATVRLVNAGFSGSLIHINTTDEAEESLIINIVNMKFDSRQQHRAIKVKIWEKTRVTLDSLVIENGEADKEEEDNGKLGGGIYVDVDSERNTVIVSNNEFINNYSAQSGGGMYCTGGYDSEINIVNNIFSRNTAKMAGGGLRILATSGMGKYNILNNTFSSNTAIDNIGQYGGGMYISVGNQSEVNVVNNIFANSFDGGGIVVSDSNNRAVFQYNGFYNNKNCYEEEGEEVCEEDQHTKFNSELMTTIDELAELGEGNTICNPGFVDADNDDLHLSENSSCIDAGDDLVLLYALTDAEGNAREQGSAVDLGAYEMK